MSKQNVRMNTVDVDFVWHICVTRQKPFLIRIFETLRGCITTVKKARLIIGIPQITPLKNCLLFITLCRGKQIFDKRRCIYRCIWVTVFLKIFILLHLGVEIMTQEKHFFHIELMYELLYMKRRQLTNAI